MRLHILNYDKDSQKMVGQMCIKFTDLMNRVKFTYRKASDQSPYQSEEKEFYQRETNKVRVGQIKKYLRKEILNAENKLPVIFPTAMLLACYYDEPIEEGRVGMDIEVSLPEYFYVVDGQHRLASMMELYDEVYRSVSTEENRRIISYLKTYEFNCTVLFNLDLWEQGLIFADVNFQQKPVSKSLYYDVYGTRFPESSDDYKRNYICLAHAMTKFVNNKEESPLKGFVKMLGNGKGLFSQASLAEALIANMSSPQGVWYIDPDGDAKSSYRYMTIELFTYFNVVANTFKDLWPKQGEMKHRSILCKTTGIQSMVKLMGFLHKNKIDDTIFIEISNINDSMFNQPYADEVEKYLKKLLPYKNELFGLQDAGGLFCGTGGKGLVSKLYKRMVEIINE